VLAVLVVQTQLAEQEEHQVATRFSVLLLLLVVVVAVRVAHQSRLV
jgi:hypothetical protein